MPFFQVVARGTVATELWNASFGLVSESDGPTVLDELVQRQASFFTAGVYSTGVSFGAFRVTERVVATGEPVAVVEGGGPVVGGVSGIQLPPQVAEVVTVRTAVPGLTGRYYLPACAATACGTDGRLTPTARTTILNGAGAFFQQLNALVVPIQLVVWRRPVTVPAEVPGLTVPATSIDIGNVFDTQRRRRNRLVEARASEPV
jgi:hypothetical protein